MIFTRSNNQDKDDIIIIFLLYNITTYILYQGFSVWGLSP